MESRQPRAVSIASLFPHPSSLILHPLSFILPNSSFRLRDLDLLLLGRFAQLAQRPGLDLPDPLLRHPQFRADLLERQRLPPPPPPPPPPPTPPARAPPRPPAR